MKKVLLLVSVFVFFGCGSEQSRTVLPGSFKYLSYNWNNSKDSVGLSLLYYLDIAKDGNYSLIVRNKPDSTGYYYGFIGNATLEFLNHFATDTTSYNNYYLVADTASKALRYKFDYADSTASKKITFATTGAPQELYKVQEKLDSIVNAPNKKKSQVFNIDLYLRKLIAEDSGALSRKPVLKK